MTQLDRIEIMLFALEQALVVTPAQKRRHEAATAVARELQDTAPESGDRGERQAYLRGVADGVKWVTGEEYAEEYEWERELREDMEVEKIPLSNGSVLNIPRFKEMTAKGDENE